MAVGYITVYPDSPESFTVEIPEGKVLPIGRKPSPESHEKLVLALPEVSANHAELYADAGGWSIQDTGSTNGTRLNGEMLTPGRKYPLQSGDRIRIAQVDLLVTLPEGTPVRQVITEEHTFMRISLFNATILVGDIRGFSTLMEEFATQPEVVMQAAHRVFQALNKEIFANHGVVEKIAGDAVMAYWQDDAGHTNAHAIQACHAALGLQRLVTKELCRDRSVWPFGNHPLYLDMALATGAAAAGTLGMRESSPAVLGDMANLAFRLEKLVSEERPGDIVVDGSTYMLAKDHFVFEALGEFSVKGRQRPVEVYRLSDFGGPQA
jgi:class 3 adenylate cyclase